MDSCTGPPQLPLVGKHVQHDRELHLDFIDFKKAPDRVGHEGH